jgi:hypothetical protein
MALKESISRGMRKVPLDGCIHCARGWTCHEDEETGEEIAIPCWMCDTLDAQHAGLERMGGHQPPAFAL